LNRKVLEIAVVLMAVAMLAVPVMANPTQGQKVAVTMTQIATGPPTTLDEDVTGPITHSHSEGYYNVEIDITDGPTLIGTAVVDRKLVRVPQKGSILGRWIFTDYYEITIDTKGGAPVDGGFEGNGKVILDGVNPATMGISWEKGRANVLLHGTEDFEGQTLNFNVPWNAEQDIVWDGYLLKP
jgi:hypothetical protein